MASFPRFVPPKTRRFLKEMTGLERVNRQLASVDERLAAGEEATSSLAAHTADLQASLATALTAHKADLQALLAAASGEMRAESEAVMHRIRAEYTVMARFQFHQPLDYSADTVPPGFEPPVYLDDVELPIPGPKDRMGYSPTDAADYLNWGALDHDIILSHINKVYDNLEGRTILDFGCSSGRVLRHFAAEHRKFKWRLYGVDVQAHPIEWMRYHFPPHFQVAACSTMPHLPFADASFDFIYGISVFTHIKYLWDMWLLELKRVLKPGGLLLQTIHAEPAWEFYHANRDEEWVKQAHSPRMLEEPKMVGDYLYFGDAACSQVFWKEEVARRFWGRYFEVIEVAPPPARSFQNWMICRKCD